MDVNQQLPQFDAAIRRPETIVETEAEVSARDRAQQLYRQSNYGLAWINSYEAGWKAAKAYYEEVI